jgi:hypothetical protein
MAFKVVNGGTAEVYSGLEAKLETMVIVERLREVV